MANFRMSGAEIFDNKNHKIGAVKSDGIYNEKNQKVGSTNGSNIYNEKNQLIGALSGSDILDAKNHKIGNYNDVKNDISGMTGGSVTMAALWLLFVR